MRLLVRGLKKDDKNKYSKNDASGVPRRRGTYLVDPASSHMLVTKIKPCMSEYLPTLGETANGSLNQSRFTGFCEILTRITVVILELIRATSLRPRPCLALGRGKGAFVRTKNRVDSRVAAICCCCSLTAFLSF